MGGKSRAGNNNGNAEKTTSGSPMGNVIIMTNIFEPSCPPDKCLCK
jgi:hypothetical protein